MHNYEYHIIRNRNTTSHQGDEFENMPSFAQTIFSVQTTYRSLFRTWTSKRDLQLLFVSIRLFYERCPHIFWEIFSIHFSGKSLLVTWLFFYPFFRAFLATWVSSDFRIKYVSLTDLLLTKKYGWFEGTDKCLYQNLLPALLWQYVFKLFRIYDPRWKSLFVSAVSFRI